MGIIRIALVDEHGAVEAEVEGDTHSLDDALGRVEPKDSICLRFVDPYGDTIFNHLQMEPFLAEWAEIERRSSDLGVRTLVGEVRALAERCRREPHTFLRFYGD
jgi:hypothetical protein